MKAFFIVGEQRSGTTLLSVMLGKHPDIHIFPNSYGFRLIACFDKLETVLPYNLTIDKEDLINWLIEGDYKGRLKTLLGQTSLGEKVSIREMVSTAIQQKIESEGKVWFGDKVPNMQHHLPRLLMMFPDARIIHIVRDGRANAFSAQQRGHKNLFVAAQQWVEGNISGLAHQLRIGSDRYQLLRYEDLVSNPTKAMETLCKFLDIPFVSEMITPGQSISKTASNAYVKPDLDLAKVNAYRKQLSPKQIRIIEKIQGPLLHKLGYELSNPDLERSQYRLPIWKEVYYRQSNNLRLLFRRDREGMQNRMKRRIVVPWKSRLKRFTHVLASELLSEKLHRHLFRKVWTKELLHPDSKKIHD